MGRSSHEPLSLEEVNLLFRGFARFYETLGGGKGWSYYILGGGSRMFNPPSMTYDTLDDAVRAYLIDLEVNGNASTR